MPEDRFSHTLDAKLDERLADEELEALAEAVATPAPAELRQRILAEVGAEMRDDRRHGQVRFWRSASVIGLAAGVVFALLYANAESERDSRMLSALRLEQEQQALQQRIDAQKAELALVNESLEVQGELVRILAAPRLLTAMLIPRTEIKGHARVLLDPDSGAVAVIGKGLPPPDNGRSYELWALREAQPPVSAGRLSGDAQRSFALKLREVEDPSTVREFVVSVERDSGPVPSAPTGPIVLAGRVAAR